MGKIITLMVLIIHSISFAVEKIQITNGTIEPTPIASVKFIGITPLDQEIGKEITQVINNDLKGSGLFRIIDEAAYIETIRSIKHRPNFAAWRPINASAILVGEVFKPSNNEIRVEYKLWDPYSELSTISGYFQTKDTDWRRVGHKVADAVYKRITGEEGYFDTKILFIAASGPAKHRIKRLAIMDQDGANMKYLSDGKSLTLTPRFSPDNHKALYLSYAKNKPRVHLRNLNSGSDQILGNFKGMTFAPRFSPNGKEVIMSSSVRGTTDIFLLDAHGKNPKQLTKGAYINTSPYFSPDGNKIVFVSDRSGTPQLYTMDKDGSSQERISFGLGRYFAPVWSPRGDYIAFIKLYMGTFYIGVMRADGSGERVITQGYLLDSPAWAPNGRVLIYTKGERYRESGKAARSTLNTIDITGNFERTLQLPVDASDPSWSNNLE